MSLRPALPFKPAVAADDLVDRMAVVHREWRRDNGLFCLQELRSILDLYPWSFEAARLYGEIRGRVAHLETPLAAYRLHEWMARHQAIKGEPYWVDEKVERFKLMHDMLRKWLASHEMVTFKSSQTAVVRRRPRKSVPQWATLLDIGGQMGEMSIHFTGTPGILSCFCCELALTNCVMGHQHRYDPRLHFVSCFADHLPFPSESVDVVVLAGILEHVLNPMALVEEAERVLRPGGLVIVQCPYGGMENVANPAADRLSFRSHVGMIDPYALVKRGKPMGEIAWVDYTEDIQSPHSWYGTVMDWVAGWEKTA